MDTETSDSLERERLPLYLSHSYYVSNLKSLEPLFRLTRMPQVCSDPQSLLYVQEVLIDRALPLSKVIREGKQLIDVAKARGDSEKLKSLEMCLGMNRHLLRLIHMMMDGVAWRMFNFDRPFLRLTSEPDRNLGSVDFSIVFPGMKAAAQKLMKEHGSSILFNDLTNVLRLGDLTEFLPDGTIVLHELKKGGLAVKNIYTVANMKGGISRQIEHMVKAQMARDLRFIYTDDGSVIEIDNFGFPLGNDLDSINRLVRRARRDGIAHTTIGHYLFVEACDFPRVGDLKFGRATGGELGEPAKPPWTEDEDIVYFDSMQVCLGDGVTFARNATPYSVFPFGSHECFDLMSGRLMLRMWLNLSEVARILTEYGWQVENLASTAHVPIRPPGPKPFASTDMWISAFRLSRPPFNLEIALPQVLRIATDFMRPTVLAALAESSYRSATYGKDTTAETFIISERDIWV